MHLNENDGKNNANLEELGIQISEEMQIKLGIEDMSNVKRNNVILKDDIECILYKYYESLSDTIQKKEMLEQRKERHKEFMTIYEPVEREYLNNEDIFDPDYTIKGVKIKKVKEIKDVTKKKTIDDLGLIRYSFNGALVYLHHSGISTIHDLLSKAENVEQLKEFLNSIEGLDWWDKDRIIENVTYLNEEKLNEDEEVDSKFLTDIGQLELSPRSLNCLKRAGIYTVGELAYKMKEGELSRVRGLVKRSVEEIVTKMQEYEENLKTEEEEKTKQHENVQLKLREEREKSYQEKNLEDSTLEDLQHQIEENEKIIATNEEKIKDALIDVTLAEQKKIKSQEAEISDLENERRNFDE